VGLVVGHPTAGQGGGTVEIAMVTHDSTPNTYGVFYKNTTSTNWTAATTDGTTVIGQNLVDKHAEFWWEPNTDTVFLYDPSTGVWISTTDGASWSQLTITGGVSLVSNKQNSGFMAGDPAVPNQLYLSLRNSSTPSVISITNADNLGGKPTETKLTSADTCFTSPLAAFAGPIAVDASGVPYLAVQPSTSCPATLFQGTSANGTTLARVDNTYPYTGVYGTGVNEYNAQAEFANQLTVGADGYIYMPTYGDGLEIEAPIIRCPQGC
jgi:hypothetical protein